MSTDAVLSLDGCTVVFASTMTGLLAGKDRNGAGYDVYLVRLATGAIQRFSVTKDGEQCASGTSHGPSLSGDGRFVAFTSSADLIHPHGAACAGGRHVAQRRTEVYVRDTKTGAPPSCAAW